MRSFNVVRGTPHSNAALLIPILPSTTRSKASGNDVPLHWRSLLDLLLCCLALFAVNLQHLFVTAMSILINYWKRMIIQMVKFVAQSQHKMQVNIQRLMYTIVWKLIMSIHCCDVDCDM